MTKDEAISALEEAAMLASAADSDESREDLNRVIKQARESGVPDDEISRIVGECGELMEDLIVTFGGVGSLSVGGVTYTPTEKARERSRRDWDRVHDKYNPRVKA